METPTTLVIAGRAELEARVGTVLGTSGRLVVDQPMIDAFATLSGDDYWIHVDRERAAASPRGGTIAHGLLTLSLWPRFAKQIYRVEGFDGSLNYGFGKVRFPAPLPVGSRLRMRATLEAVEDVPGGVLTVVEQRFEVEDQPKPVCVAQALVRYALPA